MVDLSVQFSLETALACAGFLAMCFSMYLACQLWRKLQHKGSRRLWRFMVSLVGIFALAYGVLFFATLTGKFSYLPELSSVIFFGGAIFVCLTVAVSTRMNAEILKHTENLEHLVNERTLELKEAYVRLTAQEENLMAASKMSALGEMAGGVAHELNNPLAVIQLFSGLLAEVIDETPLDKERVKDMATNIEKTVQRIAKIVAGLRSFSRDGSDDPFERASLAQIIQDTLTLCTEKFRQHGIALEGPEFSDRCFLECRAVQISQVLLNLLNNAHDAVGALPEKWIRLEVSDLGEKYQVRLSDSGKGIDKEIREKLFQPFFTTKEIGKGTGLGLSISSGIIRIHNGSIQLDSAYPNTCFVIELPKCQPNKAGQIRKSA